MREKNQYTNSSQQALLAVVETLAGQPLRAQTLTGLADSLGAPRDGVYRTLKNLHQGGWVEEQGRRLGAQPASGAHCRAAAPGYRRRACTLSGAGAGG